MAEKWNKRWDGVARPHETFQEKLRNAGARREAERLEHERKLTEDPKYRKQWEREEARKRKEQAKKEQTKAKRKATKERKREKVRIKHGVFDAVVPEGEDGVRRCPRCQGSAFTRHRLRSPEFTENLVGGPVMWAAVAAVGKASMVCDHCGAAFPLEWHGGY